MFYYIVLISIIQISIGLVVSGILIESQFGYVRKKLTKYFNKVKL